MTPKGWTTVQFKDIASLEYGAPLPGRDRESGAVPVYGSNGIVGFHNKPLIRAPGIVIGRKGTAGSVHFATSDFWPIDTTYYVEPRAAFDEKWLYYVLVNKGLDHLNQTTGVPGLNRNDVYKLPIHCPTVTEQAKIATILASVDDAIERTQSLIAQLRRVKQALLRNVVCRGLPGAHQRFRKIKDLGEIPNDWTTVNLGDIAEKITSGSRGWAEYYADEGKLFLRITNLTRNSITPDLSDVRYVMPPQGAEGSRTKVQTGDLLVSITADLGIIGRIPEGYPEAYINQHIALVRLKPGAATPDWVALFLASPVGQIQFQRLNDPGAKAGLNLESIRRLTVVLPSLAEQQRIAALINGTDQATVDEMSMLEQLKVVKSGLMHVLLSGRKRVPISTPRARTA
jgi:type I restriction enzyme S subunit